MHTTRTMTPRLLAPLALATLLVLGTGCGSQPADPAGNTSTPASTGVTGTVTDELDKASAEVARNMATVPDEITKAFAKENITVSDDASGPKAEITPQGDLLIDGRKVDVDQTQRALLLAYRQQIALMASEGARIGLQGAGVGLKAVAEVFRNGFNVDGKAIEETVRAEAEKVKAQASTLCDRMPAMLEAQQKLAAALPEFAPFARMDSFDIAECREDVASAEPGQTSQQ